MDVTLTFDNGPDLEETPKVLDVLRRTGVSATFFLVCDKLRSAEGRKMAERTKGEGHWLGNHTLSHKVPLGMNPDPNAAATEIGEAQTLLGDLAEQRKFFRPNGRAQVGPHLLSRTAVDLLLKGRFTCVLWSVVPRDTTEPDLWVDRAFDHCLTVPWATVVVHDRPTGAMRHLEDFILKVRDAGGSFRQDFNPEVIPIADGKALMPLDAISNDDPASARLTGTP